MDHRWRDQLHEIYEKATGQTREMTEALMVISPVAPYADKGMVTVLVTAAGLISIALLGGVGLVSMAILLVALGLIFMILSSVFGITFDVDPADLFRAGAGPW